MKVSLVTVFALLLQASPAIGQDVPIPEKIPSPPSEELAPAVTIRTADNGDVVEEYRQAGAVYMVRVTPKGGVPYSIMDGNGDGKIDGRDFEEAGGVLPVHYTIAEWD